MSTSSHPKYDYLIVGSGLFGSVFAHEAAKRNLRVLVLEKRTHIGGNCYTQEWKHGINVHVYGPHIFHTANKRVWDYMNQFCEFNNFTLRAKARYGNRVFSFPINLMTLHQMWGVTTPAEAEYKLQQQRIPCEHPRNLEEWILSQVGEDLYEGFIYGYTKKHWGREPSELPASIIRRLPIRLTYNDRYYPDHHKWEGIPKGGYTPIFHKLLDGIQVLTDVDYLAERREFEGVAEKVLFTGPIDAFFEHRFGALEYRSLHFENEEHEGDFQGAALVTYPDVNIPWTRIVEHKHFEFIDSPTTLITKEHPVPAGVGREPYYPINDVKNMALLKQYEALASQERDVLFGGRLGSYRYFDMDMTVGTALSFVSRILDGGG